MLLVAVTVLAIASTFLAAFALFESSKASFATLSIAVAASVVLTALSLMLIPSWEAHMQHVDVAAMRRAWNYEGKFPQLAWLSLYLAPYEAALLGASATGGFAWALYRRVRYGY